MGVNRLRRRCWWGRLGCMNDTDTKGLVKSLLEGLVLAAPSREAAIIIEGVAGMMSAIIERQVAAEASLAALRRRLNDINAEATGLMGAVASSASLESGEADKLNRLAGRLQVLTSDYKDDCEAAKFYAYTLHGAPLKAGDL